MDRGDAMILLGALGVVHVLTFLFSVWSVDFRCFSHGQKVSSVMEAEVCKVIPAKFCGVKEVVPLFQRQLLPAERATRGQPWAKENSRLHSAADAPSEDDQAEFRFEFRKQTFWYCRRDNLFKKLAFPTKESLELYARSRGYGSEPKAEAASEKWGRNMFQFPEPSFWGLFKEQLMEPFFVFQVFCVGLWCLDEYWQYSLFTLLMLLLFESTMASGRLRTLKDLRRVRVDAQTLLVHRAGKWTRISGVDLLPGDFISIGRPTGPGSTERTVPADMLLTSGSVIVNEALLTGESTPQWKGSIQGRDLKESLSIRRDKANVLFGGTKIVQHTIDKNATLKTPDGGCTAIVLRTGFDTSQGKLMRTILFSTERVSANNHESGIFILILVFFALIAAGYVLIKGLENPSLSRYKLLLNCSLIVTSVVPPELPMELTIAVNTALLALIRKGVYCTEPFRIPFAGKLDVCCFDKTGTLTSDDMVFRGVVEAEDLGSETPELKNDPQKMSYATLATLASCHALVPIDGKLVGDPLEKAALQGSDWLFSEDFATPRSGPSPPVQVLQRHHFASHLKRMAVLVRVEASGTFLALVKGAPETVQSRLSIVPEGYSRAYKAYARQGGRVLAMGFREFPAETPVSAIRSMERDEVESGLTFAGFAVFGCPLRPDSAEVLRELKEARHDLVMITGDQALTACHVAGEVHIITRRVLILTPPPSSQGDAPFSWVSPEEDVSLPFDPLTFPSVALAYDLCVTGEGLSFLQGTDQMHRVVPLVQVFARVSPEQKELILTSLRSAGRTALMCGDGTNDVGALKQAHVGVALLNVPPPKKPAGKSKKKKAPSASSAVTVPGPPLSAHQRRLAEQQRRLSQLIKEANEGAPDGAPPVVQLGDASMASPFTAKFASVQPNVEIVRQGRAALVTTLQMFKILGLNCLISAYVLSALNLDGVKLGDTQATISGVCTAVLFLVLSQSRPLASLAPCKPYPGVLNAYVALSLTGQSALHLLFLATSVSGARKFMPEECPEPQSPFQPNLANTVSYTCQLAVQLATFGVNYAGHPFRESLTENRPFLLTLSAAGIFFSVLAVDLFPAVRSSMELVPLPQPYGTHLLLRAAAMMAGCLLCDRLAAFLFPVKSESPLEKLQREEGRAAKKDLQAKKRD